MLTVDDPAFWQGVEPVKFGVLPRLQDSVTVIGCATCAFVMLHGNVAAFQSGLQLQACCHRAML